MLVRTNDVMVSIGIHSAIIEFADILAKTEIVPDENDIAPWGMMDGFDHSVSVQENASRFRGYIGRNRVVMLPNDEDYGIYEYMHKRGASKQVAREGVVAERRRTLDQLVAWYRNGWEWLGVKCNFMDCHDSLWGIDDYGYAEEVREDIASNVAYELEKKGYTVTGKPQPVQRKHFSRLHEQDCQSA